MDLLKEGSYYWFDYRWFLPETFKGFEYDQPVFLYLIPVIPVLFVLFLFYKLVWSKRIGVAVEPRQIKWSATSILGVVPYLLIFCSLLLFVFAMSKPKKMIKEVKEDDEIQGIDIVLILDISGSMKYEDFKPNRLATVKRVANQFIEGRQSDRIGAVVFAGDAHPISPLTFDYPSLKEKVKNIDFNDSYRDGTAIGNAILSGILRTKYSKAKSKVLILLSDGESSRGNIDPISAAKKAEEEGNKIYTIGIGRDGKVPITTPYGVQYVDNSFNEQQLQRIANIGNGHYYRATSEKALKSIFKTIDQLEKTKIKKGGGFKIYDDFYEIYVMWGVILFGLWLLTKATFLTNATED
jgi:Ca-activated chloride channel family protein